MAFPILPLLIIGGVILMAGRKKPTGNGNGNGAVGETVSITWDELKASSEIGINTGDTLVVRVAEAAPASWTLYTEAVAGDPIIVVTEEHVDPAEPVPGDYGDHVYTIAAHQAGQIKASLVQATTHEHPEVWAEHTFLLNIA